jgi:type I restriction enzyme R subunit
VIGGIVRSFPQLRGCPSRIHSVRVQPHPEAVSSEEVVDIFALAKVEKPNISILSPEFLEEAKGMKFPNLQIELFRKLLDDEIRVRTRRNVLRYRSFQEMLEQAIQAYHQRTLTSAEIIQGFYWVSIWSVEHVGPSMRKPIKHRHELC